MAPPLLIGRTNYDAIRSRNAQPPPASLRHLLVITGCVAQTFLSCAPTFVGLMAQDWHYTEAQQGFVVTAEIGGVTVEALLVSFVLARRSVRNVVLFGHAFHGGSQRVDGHRASTPTAP